MNNFAKLFDTDIGQILVMLDNDDSGEPVIILMFKDSVKTIKLQISNFTSDDDEDTFDVAKNRFDLLEKDDLYRLAKNIIASIEVNE